MSVGRAVGRSARSGSGPDIPPCEGRVEPWVERLGASRDLVKLMTLAGETSPGPDSDSPLEYFTLKVPSQPSIPATSQSHHTPYHRQSLLNPVAHNTQCGDMFGTDNDDWAVYRKIVRICVMC